VKLEVDENAMWVLIVLAIAVAVCVVGVFGQPGFFGAH
jgi:hypothetical protein